MGRMIEFVVSSLYFILPAYFANMMPVFAAKLRLPGGRPVSMKWLGAHKTWRGLYAGYIGALIVLAGQWLAAREGLMMDYTILDYESMGWMIFGYSGLFGFGALIGDSVKSFFKRRVGVKPGGAWFPFDQIDFVLGAFLFLWPFVEFHWSVFVIVLFITPGLHFLVNVIAYLVGLKKVWW
jgi:CDP-2,3-bis-(O-geranylgeranyl)-sn-glycerol synthase